MSASVFERELKGILHGDEDMVHKVSRTCPDDVKEEYRKIIDKPFIMVRAAGSLGVDLVAIREDFAFPIEVKTSSYSTIRFSDSSGRATKQAEDLIEECRRSGLIPLYAFRMKGIRGNDSWCIFTAEMEGVKGRLRTVYNRLPKIEKTPKGHFLLKFKDGMPLHKFIDYIC